jgi:tetratricopeptide (TPR) repeat protein
MAEFFDGSLETAEKALREARSVACDDSQAREFLDRIDDWLGNALRSRGQAAEAVAIQRRLAFDTDPSVSSASRHSALFQLGLSLCYLRDLPGARNALERLITTDVPDDPILHRARVADLAALISVLAGDQEAVLEATADGIAAYAESAWPDDAPFLYNVRAVALLGADDLAAAAIDLEHALATAHDFAADRAVGLIATNLAWLRLRQGRYKEALAAAHLGAQRLGANSVKEVTSARALAALLSDIRSIRKDEIRRELVKSAHLALDNPDLYQPTAEVFDQLATDLAEWSSRS